MRRIIHGFIRMAAILFMAFVYIPPSHSAVYLWIDPSGGSYQDASNWYRQDAQGGWSVPEASDEAVFSLGTSPESPYTVTLNQSLTQASLAIVNDAVHFDLGGYYFSPGSVQITSGAGHTGYMKITNGNFLVGRNGTGTLNISNGGRVSNSNGYLGYDDNSQGTATVDGEGQRRTEGQTRTEGQVLKNKVLTMGNTDKRHSGANTEQS